MFRVKPTIYVKHIEDINYEKLKGNGIKLICFDIDNTLDAPDCMTVKIDASVEEALIKVENLGFEIFLISNNKIANRASSFANIRGYEFLDSANKPFQSKYKSLEILKRYKKKEVIFVGDKLVTDILGAEWYGSQSILVDPLVARPKNWYSAVMLLSDNIFSRMNGFKRGSYYDE